MPAQTVEEFLGQLDHPLREEILALRKIILSVSPAVGEEIKWNAPSFHTAEHFATFNLRAKKGVALILHFGAKKNAISETGVEIADPSGMLQWLGKDRAQVQFADMAEVKAKRAAFTKLLREWIKHV